MSLQPITSSSILRVLIVGFTLVILLLLAAAFVAVRSTRSIKDNAASLVEEQLVSTRLIDEVQREQGTLSAVLDNLAHDPDSVDRERILAQLNESERHIARIVAAAAGTQEQPLWRELKHASAAFSGEARRLLALDDLPPVSSRALFRHHDQVVALVARLAAASYEKASAAEDQIKSRSGELERNSLALLGACLILALLCAALTMRMTAELFRRMEWQTGELSRVSWHMLENQEATARRFSHELHDELGQSLTAIKANLLALSSDPVSARSRLGDCLQLVDQAIGNVRELSQLLRPTILDDFGLDAGLRWLCERFAQRTGIEVDYSSDFTGRLADETETHLFRIAQEALTNVARHSGAGRVRIALRAANGNIHLSIGDNGRGLRPGAGAGEGGLGMVGMRARARDAGGELALHAKNGDGLLLEVTVPARGEHHDKKDPNSAGG